MYKIYLYDQTAHWSEEVVSLVAWQHPDYYNRWNIYCHVEPLWVFMTKRRVIVMLSWIQKQLMLLWLQLCVITDYVSKLQPYSKKYLLFLFIAIKLKVLQLVWLWWSGMTMPGLWGFSCVVVEDSFSTAECWPCRPHHIMHVCQPWHQETWKSLKQLHMLGYILLFQRDTEPVNISHYVFNKDQVFLCIDNLCMRVWNVSLDHIKDIFSSIVLAFITIAVPPDILCLITAIQGSPHTRLSFSENPKKETIFSIIEMFTSNSEMYQILKQIIS